jgi:CubicO group peptidase (beta-lactamase class C family)
VIVERAAGKPLREFARERIFAPLGMTRTHVPTATTTWCRLEGGGLRVSIPPVHGVESYALQADGSRTGSSPRM